MPNGKIIRLKEAQDLIRNYVIFRDQLQDLAAQSTSRGPASAFLTKLTDHNAYIIDSKTLRKLKEAKYCIVFLAKENDGSPTIVVANCDKKRKKYIVPSETIAALEHIPPRMIPTIEKALDGTDIIVFGAAE